MTSAKIIQVDEDVKNGAKKKKMPRCFSPFQGKMSPCDFTLIRIYPNNLKIM